MWKLLTRSVERKSKDATTQRGTPPSSSGVPPKPPEAQASANPKNRRQSTRYSAVNDRLWLGWWADEEFNLVDAQLVNISEGGVLIHAERAPEAGQVVWMRLEGTSTPESLAAIVLESRWVTLRRRWVVRLEFQQACPPDFYTTAVFGG